MSGFSPSEILVKVVILKNEADGPLHGLVLPPCQLFLLVLFLGFFMPKKKGGGVIYH